MSATVAGLAAGALAPERADAPNRRLRVVDAPARRRRPRLFYGIVAVLGAFLIAGAQMALSIMTTQGTYELSALTQEQKELTYQKQILYDDVAGLSSPQYLAANAASLGMVINEAPSYLRLSDGAILGPSQAAIGASSVDVLGRGSVPNALITQTPLITAPDATIDGVTVDETPPPDAGVDNTPPPLTDGLPTPTTR